ncbi:MAG: hypothetical protein CMH63_01050 [Nanoarchaeota archaeon]|jgi:hypothetical protein|nr:hypothetical protein [Nanoarchaeota archaeon]|tara:strand:+ start:10560 stop:11165 length:606 start_codon:yes stop_codon:yes gene_type:complete
MLGHICGDGTIVRCRPEKGIRTSYSNSEIELIKGFDFLMKKIFGEVESYLYNVDISSQVVKTSFTYTKPHYQISYPTIISYLILSVYDYKYNDKMEFPEFILDLDEKARCGFLRALFDDEGYVNEKHKVVRIGMKPFNFMKGVDRTLNSVGIETKGIRREKDKMYYIKIYNKKNQILYSKKINFKHPLKKKRLKKLINFIK